MSNDKILSKVRKLFNLAGNAGATEGERDNAIRMAHNLLAKHNLDMAEVEASGQTPQEARDSVTAEFYSAPWTRTIGQATAKLYFCKYLFIKGTKKHLFIGKVSNATAASEIAKWLFKSVDAESYKLYPNGNTGQRPGFQRGAADIIYNRVEEIIAASREQASAGKSLVLADVYNMEAAANQELMAKLFPYTTTSKARKSNIDVGAYYAGAEFGKKVNLNRQLGGNSQPANKQITG
jgi:hypothetical protein